MPAALLVLLAALAGVFGVPATASDGPVTTTSVIHQPVIREAAPQRLLPARSTPAARAGATAAVHALARRATALRSGPVPTAVPPAGLLLLVVIVLGRVVGGGDAWSLLCPARGSLRGRAPPAYALA